MPFAVVVTLNGSTVVLSVHPTLEAANAAAKASLFADAFVAFSKTA